MFVIYRLKYIEQSIIYIVLTTSLLWPPISARSMVLDFTYSMYIKHYSTIHIIYILNVKCMLENFADKRQPLS